MSGGPNPNLPSPDEDQARATGGTLCHFVASDPFITERFRRWVEHHEGDLTAEDVRWYLGLVHDLLSPECADPVTHDFRPERR
jgi:hypothetical protein